MTQWSHVEKIAAIAVELAALGYPITFIVGRTFQNHIVNLHPNIKFLPLQGLDDKMSDEDTATFLQLSSGVEQEIFIMKKVLADGIKDGHDTLQSFFKEFRDKYGNKKPLISLYDQTVPGHHPILMGGPGLRPDTSIGISLAPLTLDSNDTYPFRTGKAPHTGPESKELHRKAYEKIFDDRLEREFNQYWWEKLEEAGVKLETYPRILHAMGSLPDYLMTLGVPEFQFPRSDLRPNVRYFGAFKKVGKQGDDTVSQLPSWWEDVVKAKAEGLKIVAVSQGTVEVRPEDLVLPALEALKDRKDILVIATFVVSEPEDVPGLVVPSNARVAKFVPYDLLLPLVDVLVTNGGYGAVQHCLRLGVPMVVSGEGQDKTETNAIIEYTGVGINLKGRYPGVDSIRDAVARILEDETFKTNVKSLSTKYEKYDIAREFDRVISDAVRDWQIIRRWRQDGSVSGSYRYEQ
ncbi:UDP-Glycosyltransferase/glycogen phosphorylase [Massarina eburnea CBS 473.64]|uniref:UDP-Glycosyltransferase/glycogen phosphorylase n=1 Tax=Massarina eburnea CBS 473.64 TaxID=1395130 RepID=A0A6A6SH57_9PLEO|nr:UDP-Glycosyltransferase/glycogen phosphorylase [Massarina eburnea CBS 473.64]